MTLYCICILATLPFSPPAPKNSYLCTQAAGEGLVGDTVFICPKHKDLNSCYNKMLMLDEIGGDSNQGSNRVCNQPLLPSGMAAVYKHNLLFLSLLKEQDLWALSAHVILYHSITVPATHG